MARMKRGRRPSKATRQANMEKFNREHPEPGPESVYNHVCDDCGLIYMGPHTGEVWSHKRESEMIGAGEYVSNGQCKDCQQEIWGATLADKMEKRYPGIDRAAFLAWYGEQSKSGKDVHPQEFVEGGEE